MKLMTEQNRRGWLCDSLEKNGGLREMAPLCRSISDKREVEGVRERERD